MIFIFGIIIGIALHIAYDIIIDKKEWDRTRSEVNLDMCCDNAYNYGFEMGRRKAWEEYTKESIFKYRQIENYYKTNKKITTKKKSIDELFAEGKSLKEISEIYKKNRFRISKSVFVFKIILYQDNIFLLLCLKILKSFQILLYLVYL